MYVSYTSIVHTEIFGRIITKNSRTFKVNVHSYDQIRVGSTISNGWGQKKGAHYMYDIINGLQGLKLTLARYKINIMV